MNKGQPNAEQCIVFVANASRAFARQKVQRSFFLPA
jgi:hypothetical protein